MAQDDVVVKGNYYGFNLYVMNPSVGAGFCVTQVLVNNKPTGDELSSNSFEIDLSLLELKTGEPVTVVIKHTAGCTPTVINPKALAVKQQFSFLSAKADKTAKINWTIKGDIGEDAFIVEQYRWNKWMQIGEVPTQDTVKKEQFSFETHPHSGINTFRIVHTDNTGNPVYSKSIKYTSKNPEITIESLKVVDKIVFSAETMWEIFDLTGNFISEGYGREIEVLDFEKGKYWLNYDNKSVNFTKK
jgi:hypothetical protein